MRNDILSLSKGIDFDSFPYQLFQKAKKFGIWNPADIDFSQDREDWKKLTPEQQETLRLRVSKFLVGEESVTGEILPIIWTLAKKGWIEEELYLTSFLFEEAKHVDFFATFLKEIGQKGNFSYSTPLHRKGWFEMLPQVIDRLLEDPSSQNLAEASAMYNMFFEGIQAETAYYLMYKGVDQLNLMPGLIEGIDKLKQDEARHISFGTHLLQRLIREEPHLLDFVENKLRNEWWPFAQEVMRTNTLDGDAVDPFGVKLSEALEFAEKQLNVRLEVLKKATEMEQFS